MTPPKKKQLVTNKLKLPQKKPILPNVVVTWNILACLDHKGFFWDLENSRCFFAMWWIDGKKTIAILTLNKDFNFEYRISLWNKTEMVWQSPGFDFGTRNQCQKLLNDIFLHQIVQCQNMFHSVTWWTSANQKTFSSNFQIVAGAWLTMNTKHSALQNDEKNRCKTSLLDELSSRTEKRNSDATMPHEVASWSSAPFREEGIKAIYEPSRDKQFHI